MFVNLGVSAISNSVGSKQFLTMTIDEYMWGYEDKLVKLANEFIPSWIDFPRFGIMDRLMALDNADNIVTIMIDPKIKPSKNEILSEEERTTPYHIQRFNGSPGLSQWGFKDTTENETSPQNCKCNLIEGTFEGGIFPPNLKANTSFRMYRRAFCRPVKFNYEDEVQMEEGYRGFRYKLDKDFLGTPDVNPDNACYCYKGRCPLKGLGNLAPCYYDIPIIISQPHFLNADPRVLERYEGLNPDPEKHDSELIVHPDIGVPLKASLKVQISLSVPQTRFNSKTRPFNNLTIPLFWLELCVEEVPSLVHIVITALYHILPIVQIIFMWLFAIIGLSMIGTSALLVFFFPQAPIFEDPFTNIDYSPIKIIPMTAMFKPELRISNK